MVAADGYLPKAFAQPGRRLVFTAGILFLSGFAALLLIAFGGITDNLIPLFAIGAFLTFTISQAGMTQHWRRRSRRYGAKLAINAVGAVSTAAALVIILIAKFAEGAWITLVAVSGSHSRFEDDQELLYLASTRTAGSRVRSPSKISSRRRF